MQQPVQAPTYSWARISTPPQWVETEPLEYHRLYRGTPRYRWWKPLVALVLAALYYITFSVVFAFVVMVPLLMATTGGAVSEIAIYELAVPDTQNPISLIVTLGSIVLMIPAVWLGMLSVGLTKTGRMWSVAGRIRWRLLGRTILPAFGALVVMNVVSIAIEIALAGGDVSEGNVTVPEIDWNLALISGVIILLLVPLQATAEELVFRGMFMQVLGAWMRNPWPAILIPSVLFGFAHIYDIWGMLSVVAMGLATAWITWRTGGLEAAISIHVVNNWVAFGFMTAGLGGETAQVESSGGSFGLIIGTSVGLALYVWWVDRGFRRRDGMRTRIDYVEGPPAPPEQHYYPPVSEGPRP